jgi:hypothetical protein
MTSVAFIAGTIPLVLSHGAGAEVRSATGVTDRPCPRQSMINRFVK